MDHTYGARLNQLQIKPLESEDLEFLRKWRNDEKISKYFRKINYISTQQQKEWFCRYQTQIDNYYWSIWEDGKIIGALSIYNIDHEKAEIGKIMIGESSARGKGYGYQSLIMAMKLGFEFLQLQLFKLNVHEKNKVALSIYKRAGFEIVGTHAFYENGSEYEMEIDIDKFKKVNPISNNIIPNELLRPKNTRLLRY